MELVWRKPTIKDNWTDICEEGDETDIEDVDSITILIYFYKN